MYINLQLQLNISQKWIHQINYYCENSISIIISVPPFMDIKKIYDKGFSKDILIQYLQQRIPL